MKNTKRYLSIFLALALAAPVFTGCDNGLDEYKSGETIAPPSDKFNAEIQFVTRLTDGALAGSDADYAARIEFVLKQICVHNVIADAEKSHFICLLFR